MKKLKPVTQRIGDIVAWKRAITADTHLRPYRFFGLSNGYWLRAQAAHETEAAEHILSPALVGNYAMFCVGNQRGQGQTPRRKKRGHSTRRRIKLGYVEKIMRR